MAPSVKHHPPPHRSPPAPRRPAAKPYPRGAAGDIAATAAAALDAARDHPLPCVFFLLVLVFMQVEYSLPMVPHSSPPFDLGFVLTRPLNGFLSARPALNSALAAANTVFVAMQTAYILWCLAAEWRPRAAIATAFMFTCRGVLGYCTQLPLPAEFLGSAMDFPVGDFSFFLFFSGHVAAAAIASTDMRRVGRRGMAWGFDALNALQALRLLATRGHYTIDLAVGVGAAVLFDHLAGSYLDGGAPARKKGRVGCSCHETTKISNGN